MSQQNSRQRSGPERHCEGPRWRKVEQWHTARARRVTTIGIITVSVLVVVGLVSLIMVRNQKSVKSAIYPVIDHIICQNTEQGNTHFHAHVSIYINGKRVLVPANVGIAPDGSCLYWLHTHDESGVIHVEAPDNFAATFGNFLDIWEQQFQHLGYPSQFSDLANWLVYVNGKPFHGDVRRIPLHSHTLMTLAYHTGVKPDTTYPWDGL